MAGALVLAGVFPLANVLTNGRAVPWYSGAAREWLERGALIVLVALVLSRIVPTQLDDALAKAERALLAPSARVFGLSLALLAFGGASFVSWWAFNAQPFTSDEMAQLFHARILASGHLAAMAETPREFFNTAPVIDAGHWFSQYPVGGPALIALGVLVGKPALVNPVLIAIGAFALYRFFRLVGSEIAARGAALLFVASPMVLTMAGSQMNHVGTLAFVAIALFAVAGWDAAKTTRGIYLDAAATGLALGCAATIRPLDAAVVAVLIGAVQVRRVVSEPRKRPSLVVQAAVGAAPVAIMLWVNAKTTGAPFLFGYEALNGAAHGLGFHVDPNGDLHTPLRGLTFAAGYVLKLSLYLFEWPLPGALVIAMGLVAVRAPSRWDLLMAAMIAGVLVAYSAYWFDGFFAGPRFLFTAMPAFVYFAARMPGALAGPLLQRAAKLIVPFCLVVAWFGPWAVSSASSRIDFYATQRTKLKTDIAGQVDYQRIENALVFVPEGWRGNLLARLRGLGANQFLADRMVTTLDACGIQTALDAPTLVVEPDSVKLARVVSSAQALGVARPVPNLPGDQAISLVPGTRPTPRCLAEFSRDSLGTMPFAMFLAQQSVGKDGRIGGNVVFARDLGVRNEELRARFGDRAWYRYVPGASQDVTGAHFVPYVRESTAGAASPR